MSISYRNRGKVPRNHKSNEVITIKIMKEINFVKELKNIEIEINISKIILIYSDKKIKANHPPIYSTLNPETNSDSPSAKSKGLRLVSASDVIIHIINNVIFPQKKYNILWEFEISLNE